ncbi:hypothetical protein M1116_03745 [Patescibacteria group bacterium]|nr:hypothetical protein [Patescibacteria group bacterium]
MDIASRMKRQVDLMSELSAADLVPFAPAVLRNSDHKSLNDEVLAGEMFQSWRRMKVVPVWVSVADLTQRRLHLPMAGRYLIRDLAEQAGIHRPEPTSVNRDDCKGCRLGKIKADFILNDETVGCCTLCRVGLIEGDHVVIWPQAEADGNDN